jgi:hypothetical protein
MNYLKYINLHSSIFISIYKRNYLNNMKMITFSL